MRSLLLAGLVLIFAGCGDSSDPKKDPKKSGDGKTTTSSTAPIIKIDGSSSVFPVAEAVAEEFQKKMAGKVNVTVGHAGTGGGFKKFLRGDTEISNASRPISASEMKGAKEAGIEYIELPICFDALTIAVNPQNDWLKSITVADLKTMWEPAAQGKITHWNQIRPEWPNEKLALFGAGTDSGTFDYFTEAIVGKAKDSRGDYTASEDDNPLVQGIAGNKYALGYIPYAYYPPNKGRIRAVPVDWDKNPKAKGPVEPSEETVLKGTYNPLSRPLFMYVNRKAIDRPEVKEFVEFFLKEGPELVREVRYVPLPDKAYEMGLQRLEKLQTGTSFGGKSAIGLAVEDILKGEPTS